MAGQRAGPRRSTAVGRTPCWWATVPCRAALASRAAPLAAGVQRHARRGAGRAGERGGKEGGNEGRGSSPDPAASGRGRGRRAATATVLGGGRRGGGTPVELDCDDAERGGEGEVRGGAERGGVAHRAPVAMKEGGREDRQRRGGAGGELTPRRENGEESLAKLGPVGRVAIGGAPHSVTATVGEGEGGFAATARRKRRPATWSTSGEVPVAVVGAVHGKEVGKTAEGGEGRLLSEGRGETKRKGTIPGRTVGAGWRLPWWPVEERNVEEEA